MVAASSFVLGSSLPDLLPDSAVPVASSCLSRMGDVGFGVNMSVIS